MESNLKTLIFIVSFLAFLSYMSYIAPNQYRVISPFDFAWFSGGIIGVASACVISTGLPCAGALAIFSFFTIFKYLLISSRILTFLIMTPLSIAIIYIVARLARG